MIVGLVSYIVTPVNFKRVLIHEAMTGHFLLVNVVNIC